MKLLFILLPAIISALYSLILQYILRIESLATLGLTMAYGGVFVLPFVIGVITAYLSEKEKPRSILFHIFFTWIPVILSMVFAMHVGWEGSICIIMGLPIYLVLSSMGGMVVAIWFHVFPNNKINLFAATAILSLPIVSGYFESYWDLPNEIRFVETKIVINATPEKIWKNIIRIPELEKSEDRFFYAMGFPRPIEATLSREGIGGVRRARFERGLIFYETITQWERDRKLQFEIQADPELTPLTTLDPHVVPGGIYFEALQGEYELEYNEILNKQKKRKVVLHLRSKYRLSTRFNFYASFWGDFLMRDIQNSILRILKKRIEAAG